MPRALPTSALLALLLTTPLVAQEVARVEIEPATVEVSIGEEVELSATAYDPDGQPVDAPVLWLTSYEIGTISETGTFLATNAGEAAIIATAGSADASVPVRVAPLPASRLELELPATTVTATSWLPLSARAFNAVDGRVWDAEIAWTSTDPSVASVAGGYLVAHRPGTVTLSGRADDAQAATTITVTEAPSGALALAASADRVRTGDVVDLSVTLDGERLSDGAFPRLTVVGDGAEITGGRFVAEEPGDFVVTADYAGATAVASIAVEPRTYDRKLELVGRGAVSFAHTGDLWVFGNAAYVGNYGDRALRVFDVSDPANPVMTDSIVVDARRVNDVKVNPEAGYAIMTREGASDRRNGIVVLDVSDPLHPTIAGEYTETVTGGVHNTFLVGELVYAVHNGTGELHIIDISDRANPREVGRWGLDKPNKVLHDVFIKDGIAYLSQWDDGLVVLDLGGAGKGGTPTEPVFVSRVYYPEGNTHVAWRWRDYVFVGDEKFPPGWDPDKPIAARGFLHVFDVSDLENPVEVATYEVPEAGVHNVWIEDDEETLYLGYYQAGLRALDVSGELVGDLYRQGREIDHYKTMADENVKVPNAPFNWGAMIQGDRIFSADFNSGLWIHTWVPAGDRPIS